LEVNLVYDFIVVHANQCELALRWQTLRIRFMF